ncbi:MAG: hypothetical protein ABIP75_00250 [Pyrinomonadaceae bacterium]
MSMSPEKLEKLGKRVQRCYGCFIAFHFKDMWLGDEATYYCNECKTEEMFSFEQFAQLLDPAKLKDAGDHHH